ncbi:MAG TPA: FprA family A-type flavoprotein [Anaerolineales bacterium]|nr:FprA family A-type flavoprotein [Anaerolineae bacterium]HIP87582.1 FprA family A-type flavoprotein [Anaerolineales bacterium]
MAEVFYDDGVHRCVRFDDLAGEGEVQANQFLIIHGDSGVLLDPGGNRMFSKLTSAMADYLPPQKLAYIVLTHQDPDVGAGLNGYLLVTDATICFPGIWLRFIPSFCSQSLAEQRVLAAPDDGTRIRFADTELVLLPAHFLHSAGNIQVYDPVSKTLFSGDLGASLLPPDGGYTRVEDFDRHVQYMEPFHQRYMPSPAVCKRWAEMVRGLEIERIAPQHGAMFEGREMVSRFIDWMADLECGAERLVAQGVYRIPS